MANEDVEQSADARDRAATRETNGRNAAIVTREATLCGKRVYGLTLRHWILLDAIGSPFLPQYDGTPDPVDVVKFLWIVSTRFSPRGEWRKYFFTRGCRKIEYGPAVVAIREFIADAMRDRPTFDPPGRGERPLSFAENVLLTAARLFPEMNPREYQNIPLAELFLFAEIKRRATRE